MRKSGGIIGLVGGVFGVFGAIVSFIVGGGIAFVDSITNSDTGNPIMAYGFSGLFYSFAVIVLAAICLNTKGKIPSILLLIFSLLGVRYGGITTGICLMLSVMGGILTFFVKKEEKKA